MDFNEILCLRIFWKSLKEIQVGLKSDKNDEYLTWGYMYIFYISLNSSSIEMCFQTEVVEKFKKQILCLIHVFQESDH
jgi:hypothetical protein